ncbi:MAG TPA: DUF2269 family protein, partial [Candidatus Thermoplasmatota archaeon]|nr:DUF2269 family protein [Candidatus Thermoplasmatota archaeon]
PSPPVDPTTAAYLVLKSIHVIAASLFLGYWVFAAYWKVSTDRARDLRVIAATSDRLLRADRAFVLPTALVLFVTGYVIVRPLGYYGGAIAEAPFALYGLFILFGIVALWYFAVKPVGVKLADIADGAVASDAREPTPEYIASSATWLLLVALIVLATLVSAILMVWRPGS